MDKAPVRPELCWYTKKGDNLVGSEVLKSSLYERLSQLFNVESVKLLVNAYSLNESLIQLLRKNTTHAIDPAQFDYFIEAVAVPGGPQSTT